MRKKILGLLAILIITVVAVVNLNIATNNEVLSELSLANVQALAVELPEIVITCSGNPGGGQCWDSDLGICFYGEYTLDTCYFNGRPSYKTRCCP